ncbi:facilitated trehalose transporter Tret1-like isoform X1 [Harmonia axyridis]|uniref:facilitated trehalose transporter Tret1-like isoform X1 n=1 Tax=Harmonia axyridis TaxID=115357 RepID=UPI001E2757A6|nr:facilitated trehalose transporter Tret1-like isoform X1 [Harmonia axyridis]
MANVLPGTEIVQYLAVFFGSLNVINSGMVYGWPSASLPQLVHPANSSAAIHLTTWEGSWLAIAPFFGALLTAPLSFSATGILGPKKTVIFTFYPYIVSWLVIAVADSFEWLFFARLIAGIADSCIFTAFPIYIDDICNTKFKRRFYSMYPISFAAGILIINLIDNMSSVTNAAWIASVLIFSSFSGLLIVPESPYFLLMKNKLLEAKQALRYTKNRDEVEEEYEKLREQVMSRGVSELNLEKIFSGPIRTNLGIGIVLVSAQQLCGITPIIFYITTVLKETDLQFLFDSSLSIILLALLLAMSIFSALISDAKSGKKFLLVSLLLCSVALFTLGVYFDNVDFRNDFSIFSIIPIAALLVYIIFYGLGLHNIPYVYMNRMYSRNIKSKCLALIYMYFSVIASAVSAFFTLMNDSKEIYSAFYFFGGCCLFNFILVLVFVPKCKDWCEEAEWLLKSHENTEQEYEFLLSSFDLSDFED